MALSAAQKRRIIVALAFRFGVDPRAALAVAMSEGGFHGAIGDAGTSFGPFQLHVGGALPAGRGHEWANSRAGLRYALRQISGVSKGLRGQAAIDAIVRRFERPAAPGAEIAKAFGYYQGLHLPGAAPARAPAASAPSSLAPLLAAFQGPKPDPRQALAALQVQAPSPVGAIRPSALTPSGATASDVYAQIQELRRKLLTA